MISASTPGAPNWVDLSTPDVEASLAFYTDLLGWTSERSPSAMGEYIAVSVDDRPVGGMMAASGDMEGMPAMWTVFVHAADIDATVQAVVDEGGSVLEPVFAIPDGSRIAVVADPGGAMFALSDGLAEHGTWYSHEPGAATWTELMTTDAYGAESFYASVFDWKAVSEATPDGGDEPYTVFLLHEDEVAGLLPMPDGVASRTPPYWSVYFATADCEASVQRGVALGASIVVPTMEIANGRFAVLSDPHGAIFNLLEHTS